MPVSIPPFFPHASMPRRYHRQKGRGWGWPAFRRYRCIGRSPRSGDMPRTGCWNWKAGRMAAWMLCRRLRSGLKTHACESRQHPRLQGRSCRHLRKMPSEPNRQAAISRRHRCLRQAGRLAARNRGWRQSGLWCR